MARMKKEQEQEKMVEKGSRISFVNRILSLLNKSEDQIQKEAVETFVADSIIECKAQIAFLQTSERPKKELEHKRETVKLQKLEKEFEETRYSIAPSFKLYIENRNVAKRAVSDQKAYIARIENDINNIIVQISEFKAVLEDLQS